MHLLDSELRNKEEWEAAEIELPKFDREAMKAATRECPQWVHFGAGNIFRAFPAAWQYLPRISCSVSAEAAERWC